MIGKAGILLGRMSKEDGNDCLRGWPEFQVLLPFMVKDEILGPELQWFPWWYLGTVHRRARHKALGNLAAQYMRWEAKIRFWNASNICFSKLPCFALTVSIFLAQFSGETQNGQRHLLLPNK